MGSNGEVNITNVENIAGELYGVIYSLVRVQRRYVPVRIRRMARTVSNMQSDDPSESFTEPSGRDHADGGEVPEDWLAAVERLELTVHSLECDFDEPNANANEDRGDGCYVPVGHPGLGLRLDEGQQEC